MIPLDTHALVWAVAEPGQLSRPAVAAIRKARKQDGLAVAAITLWELASLIARGRIHTYGTLEASLHLLVESVTIKPLTPEIAALAAQFSDDYPLDPADRLIGATARAEGLALVTRDQGMRRSALLNTIW
jgi:PIN domain nuclease of toxin-antitoxin system